MKTILLAILVCVAIVFAQNGWDNNEFQINGAPLRFEDSRLSVKNVDTFRSIDRTSDVALTSTSCQDTTDETIMWTGVIDAGDLMVGNVLKVYACGQISSVSAADILTLRLYIGSTQIATVDSPGKALSSDCWCVNFHATVRAAGSSGVIARYIKMEIEDASNVLCGTTSVDTTVSEDIIITAQWNAAKTGNTFGLGLGWLEYKN